MQPTLISGGARGAGRSGPTVFPYERVGGPSRWPDTPGATDCPNCGTTAVNVQGIADCTGCGWRSRQ